MQCDCFSENYVGKNCAYYIQIFMVVQTDHHRQSYDIMAIFKMVAVSHVGFALG